MKKVFLLLMLGFLSSTYAQNSDESYAIYSIILEDRIANWFEHSFEKVLVVERFENKFELDLELIDKVTTDSTRIQYVRTLKAYANPEHFATRFLDDKSMRRLARSLYQDFNSAAPIKKKHLDVKSAKIEIISAERYYDYFGSNLEDIADVWNKIWRKHGTKMVIELSKVAFLDDFAAVYYAHRCGGLCGAASFVMLERKDTTWDIIGEFNLWNAQTD